MAFKKKRSQEEEKPDTVGLVMTCSLFLIILTFFILLNSIAVVDDRRERKALASLIGAFGSLSGGLSPSKSGDSLIPPTAPMEEGGSDISELLSMVDQNLIQHVKIETPPNANQERISISMPALFESPGLTLKPEAKPLLSRLAGFIAQGDFPVEIIGYTDNRDAQEKGFHSNWEMSSLMAMKVLRFIIADHKIDLKRISAYGRGSLWPVESNTTPQGRKGNQRVELVFDYNAPAFVKRLYHEKPPGVFSYKRFNFKVRN